jgi:hypothetical protein
MCGCGIVENVYGTHMRRDGIQFADVYTASILRISTRVQRDLQASMLMDRIYVTQRSFFPANLQGNYSLDNQQQYPYFVELINYN